jgi:hypothetical protein
MYIALKYSIIQYLHTVLLLQGSHVKVMSLENENSTIYFCYFLYYIHCHATETKGDLLCREVPRWSPISVDLQMQKHALPTHPLPYRKGTQALSYAAL